MNRLRWTAPAIEDLRNLRDYIASDSETAAAKLMRKLISAPERLIQFPELGKKVPETDDPLIRELIVARNYRVIYLWKKPTINILGVIHARQNLAGMDAT